MMIRRLVNDNGDYRCFEVSNRIISRRGMAMVVSRLEGVEILHYPKFYDDEVFCAFLFMGKRFEISEPYGDSSVYDIYSAEGTQDEISVIAEHFEACVPINTGDAGQIAYFIVRSCIGLSVTTALIYLGYRGIVGLFG